MRQHRRVLLHSLIVGTSEINVVDLKCPQCAQVTVFDGRDRGIFAVSRASAFSRKHIDAWLYQTAMLGGLFWEVFEFTRVLSETTTAKYVRWGGLPLHCSRRLGSQAFVVFLKTIEYPAEDSIAKCFHVLCL